MNLNSGFSILPKFACSPGLPNKYELPFIGISEEEPINDNLFDGYLGIYFHGNHLNISREGKIVLYRKNIDKIAFKLSLDERIDINFANSLIFKIVLAHELSHWLFHYCPVNCKEDNCKNLDDINRLYSKINRDLHEYIAQKITREVFKIHPVFELVFKWLLSNQEEPYTYDMDESIEKIAAFKHYLVCNVENNLLIQEAINKGEIDYKCFQALIKQKRGPITGKNYGL